MFIIGQFHKIGFSFLKSGLHECNNTWLRLDYVRNNTLFTNGRKANVSTEIEYLKANLAL